MFDLLITYRDNNGVHLAVPHARPHPRQHIEALASCLSVYIPRRPRSFRLRERAIQRRMRSAERNAMCERKALSSLGRQRPVDEHVNRAGVVEREDGRMLGDGDEWVGRGGGFSDETAASVVEEVLG